MGSASYLTASATVMTKCNQISNLEMRLEKISAEKQIKHAQGCAEVASKTTEMTGKLNILKEELGEDYDSEAYQQYMAESESIENDYMLQISALRDQMEEAENKLDTQQETVQTQLEVIRAEYDEWKKLALQKAANSGYFKDGQ